MRAIYKYRLDVGAQVAVRMPRGAKVLSVGEQGVGIFVWAEVETLDDLEERYFLMYGTGHPIVESPHMSRVFIGTVQLRKLGLVFHVFESITHRQRSSDE